MYTNADSSAHRAVNLLSDCISTQNSYYTGEHFSEAQIGFPYDHWTLGVWVPSRLYLAIVCLFIMLCQVLATICDSCVNFLSLATLEVVKAMV